MVTDLPRKSARVQQRQSPAAVEVEAPFLTLETDEGVRLSLTASGRLALWEQTDAGEQRLVAQANLHLPAACVNLQPKVVQKIGTEAGRAHCHLRWGLPSAPLAELRIDTVVKGSDPAHPWSSVSHPRATLIPYHHMLALVLESFISVSMLSSCYCPSHLPLPPPRYMQSLSRGFVINFSVSAAVANASGAEIAVHLEPSGYWFGGGHFIRQMWPLNAAALEVGPWYAFDNGPNGVNNLLGPHWMTSGGLLVEVDPETPFLHVGMNAPMNEKRGWVPRKWGVGIQNATRELLPLTNAHGRVMRAGCDGLLRIQARNSYQDSNMVHPLRDWRPQVAAGVASQGEGGSAAHEMLSVRVALCATANAAEACKMALQTLSPPKQMPSAEVLRAPIWTTWARYKSRVTQAKVLQYAKEITDRGLQRSVMEIDDRWQVAYGDLSFDLQKFPDPVAMVDELHDLGFKVTTWVHPFVEEKSAAYQEGAAKGYFVGCDTAGTHSGGASGPLGWLSERLSSGPPPVVPLAPGGSAPGFFAWWNTPPVAALDVTNPEAVDWFVGRLRALQEATGIDGFKFDAGEPCFLPRRPRTHTPLATPADYTRLYVQRVAGQFAGGVSEVRTGHQTQDVAVFCRMGDRFSTWDSANGLRSLIPTLLTSGVLGYPFCLPDMIGGNAYFNRHPDAELLVRWTQVRIVCDCES